MGRGAHPGPATFRSAGKHRSAVVWWDVVPQPAIPVRIVVGAGVVAFVTSDSGNGFAEDLVNYIPRWPRCVAHEIHPV